MEQGHLHPRGNPHCYRLGPVRMKDLIPVVAKRFGELDPGNAAAWLANATRLSGAPNQTSQGSVLKVLLISAGCLLR